LGAHRLAGQRIVWAKPLEGEHNDLKGVLKNGNLTRFGAGNRFDERKVHRLGANVEGGTGKKSWKGGGEGGASNGKKGGGQATARNRVKEANESTCCCFNTNP